MKTVRIANPLQGGALYTSVRSAHSFVSRGIAHFDETGVLHFELAVQDRRYSAQIADQIAEERILASRRNGVIFWNGCRGANAMHPPFENVQFPQAGRSF